MATLLALRAENKNKQSAHEDAKNERINEILSAYCSRRGSKNEEQRNSEAQESQTIKEKVYIFRIPLSMYAMRFV